MDSGVPVMGVCDISAQQQRPCLGLDLQLGECHGWLDFTRRMPVSVALLFDVHKWLLAGAVPIQQRLGQSLSSKPSLLSSRDSCESSADCHDALPSISVTARFASQFRRESGIAHR